MDEVYSQSPSPRHCSECDQTKTTDDFYKRQRVCKECTKKRVKKWQSEHPGETLRNKRAYLERHPERRRESVAKANKKAQPAKRAWRERNQDAIRDYYARTREKWRKRGKQNYENNRDRYIEGARRHRAVRMGAIAGKRIRYHLILKEFGRICHLCGGPIPEGPGELHWDHVIPLSRGGAHSEENLRPSHAKCNLTKGNRI